jgi:hypothetical protein
MEAVIALGARKHGLSDDDIRHAFRQAFRVWPGDDDEMDMLVGPSRTGAMFIELGVVAAHDGTPVIVHAMRARAKYL